MKCRFKIQTSNPAVSMNRIAKITHFKSDLTTKLFELDYPTFDANGNRTELVRTVFPFVDGRFGSGSRVNWEYDLTSQLTFERYFLANSTEFLTQGFVNDDAGNRLTQDVNYFDQSRSIAGTYNAGNELTGLEISYPSASPTTVAFEHNKRGGRTKMTTNPSGSDSVVVNYGYNEDNSLTQYSVVAPGRELEVEFAYSGGLRVEKTASGYLMSGGQQQVYNVHKKYLLDGVDVLLELQVIASTEYVTVLNIPGVLSATLVEGSSSVVRYQLHDAQGNVIALVDADQEVSTVYLQDSWGIPLVDSDCQTVNLASSPIQVEPVPNPYRWGGAHGYYADEDVGLYLMGFRWYDSFTGRFISRDPIGFAAGDMNQYRPMGNNPVNAVDPWGLDVFFKQNNETGGHSWVVIGGYKASPSDKSARSFGAWPTAVWFGGQAQIQSPDPRDATATDFEYEQWITPIAVEMELEDWINKTYNVTSTQNPNGGSPSVRNRNWNIVGAAEVGFVVSPVLGFFVGLGIEAINPNCGGWTCRDFSKDVKKKLRELLQKHGLGVQIIRKNIAP